MGNEGQQFSCAAAVNGMSAFAMGSKGMLAVNGAYGIESIGITPKNI